jgi:hypothetical protein
LTTKIKVRRSKDAKNVREIKEEGKYKKDSV